MLPVFVFLPCSLCFGGSSTDIPIANDTAETMPFDVSLAAAPAEKQQQFLSPDEDPEIEREAYQKKENKEKSEVEKQKDEKLVESAAPASVKEVKDETVAGDENEKNVKDLESKKPKEANAAKEVFSESDSEAR